MQNIDAAWRDVPYREPTTWIPRENDNPCVILSLMSPGLIKVSLLVLLVGTTQEMGRLWLPLVLERHAIYHSVFWFDEDSEKQRRGGALGCDFRRTGSSKIKCGSKLILLACGVLHGLLAQPNSFLVQLTSML